MTEGTPGEVFNIVQTGGATAFGTNTKTASIQVK
jgi:hypothetical protein